MVVFNAPIPGQSLTTPPRNAPYERPPEITDPDEALAVHLKRLSDPDAIEDAMSVCPGLQGQYHPVYQDNVVVDIHYPVLSYDGKIKTINIEKNPQYEGVLRGIKGQYLLFHDAVINIRKDTGYRCSFEMVA